MGSDSSRRRPPEVAVKLERAQDLARYQAAVGVLTSGSCDSAPTDQFGLPRIFSIAAETDQQRSARIEAVRDVVESAFESAEINLGIDGARDLFRQVARRENKGKKPNSKLNNQLLAVYDNYVSQNPLDRAVIRSVAAIVFSQHAKLFGSEGSLQKRIYRLVTGRKRRRQRLAIEYQELTGRPLPQLLWSDSAADI